MTNEKDGAWHDYFAWTPVTVDAYRIEDIQNGKTSWKVLFKTVERRWDTLVNEDGEAIAVWRYRLKQPTATKEASR